MQSKSTAGPISGHVYLKQGKRGESWYFRARLPEEVRKRLGPAWRGKGRPPAGYFTRKTAEAKLQEILADARRGTLAGPSRPGATFADAAADGSATSSTTASGRPSTVADYQRHRQARARARSSGRFRSRTSRRSGSTLTARGSSRKAVCRRGRSTSTSSSCTVFSVGRCGSTGSARTRPRSSTGSRLAAPATSQVLSPAEVEALARAAEERAGRRAVPRRRVHRPAARRTAGAALDAMSTSRSACSTSAAATPTARGRSEVGAGAQRAADRPGREGTRRPQSPRALHRRTTISSSSTTSAATLTTGGSVAASTPRSKAAGLPAAPLPRSPTHVRHARRPGVPALRREGVHGPRRHRDDDDLRPPRPADRRGRQAQRARHGSAESGFGTRSGHERDPIGRDRRNRSVSSTFGWARLDSNQGPTDYESAALTS